MRLAMLRAKPSFRKCHGMRGGPRVIVRLLQNVRVGRLVWPWNPVCNAVEWHRCNWQLSRRRLMTLTLHLPPELEQRLIQEARRQGLPLDAYTLELLDTHLPPKAQRLELVTLLDAWIAEGDSEEPRETGEYLVRVLDEDCLANRKLFPPELKDVTW
jgi:hypothetical protein